MREVGAGCECSQSVDGAYIVKLIITFEGKRTESKEVFVIHYSTSLLVRGLYSHRGNREYSQLATTVELLLVVPWATVGNRGQPWATVVAAGHMPCSCCFYPFYRQTHRHSALSSHHASFIWRLLIILIIMKSIA